VTHPRNFTFGEAGPDQTSTASYFRAFGFVVLRQFFDPLPLSEEIDRVMHDGPVSSFDVSGGAEIRFQYVPVMTSETPTSLSLLDRAGVVAASLLDGPVLPTRAKGVRYRGSTPWHQDSILPVASVGVAAYLESLDAGSGALRVIPGSHHPEFGDALRALGITGMPAGAVDSHVLVTEPGDLIFFDEHLFHASVGGGMRRQWRIDYLRDPVTAEAAVHAKAYFAGIYAPDWDGGYDVDRYPSYGPDWRASGHASVARLEALGVYELAEKQEAFSRSRR
jgi:Phytanoyl-CoA dioxygenase (PhyH)